MTMQPFNGDLLQSLKWLQNNAPGIQSLVKLKADWYDQYQRQFWDDWQANVYNIQTASPFGLMVWCIILGVPSGGFGLYPTSAAWAYGPARKNYVYSGADPSIPDPDRSTGGNFFGGGDSEILDLDEIRNTLRLRYVALVSNGSLAFINKMLRYIFNNDLPWDFASGRYFYVADSTIESPGLIRSIILNDWQGQWLQYPTPRTNLIAASQLASVAPWAASNGTINNGTGGTPLSSGGPCNRLVEGTFTGSFASISQSATLPAGATKITVSAFVRAFAGTNRNFGGFNLGGTIPVKRVYFDVANGIKMTPDADGVTSGIIPINTSVVTGWYRVWATYEVPAGETTCAMKWELYGADGTLNHDSTPTTAFMYFWGSDVKVGDSLTSYISTPTTPVPPAPVTDYVSDSSGLVTFNTAPRSGAIVKWLGSWGGVTVPSTQIGVGDGSNKVFQIPKPAGFINPISGGFKIEYRVGPNMGLSSQLINLYNDPKIGIMPSPAGSKVTVIQE